MWSWKTCKENEWKARNASQISNQIPIELLLSCGYLKGEKKGSTMWTRFPCLLDPSWPLPLGSRGNLDRISWWRKESMDAKMRRTWKKSHAWIRGMVEWYRGVAAQNMVESWSCICMYVYILYTTDLWLRGVVVLDQRGFLIFFVGRVPMVI